MRALIKECKLLGVALNPITVNSMIARDCNDYMIHHQPGSRNTPEIFAESEALTCPVSMQNVRRVPRGCGNWMAQPPPGCEWSNGTLTAVSLEG